MSQLLKAPSYTKAQNIKAGGMVQRGNPTAKATAESRTPLQGSMGNGWAAEALRRHAAGAVTAASTLLDLAGDLWDPGTGLAEEPLERGESLVDDIQPWWLDEDGQQVPARADPRQDLIADRQARHDAAIDSGRGDNLDAAIDVARQTDMSHGYDGEVDGDLTGVARRKAILAGDVGALKTILCSEFTASTLVAAGCDLTQTFLDPATGLPVVYADGNDKHGNPRVTEVDVYMVVNTQPEATRAVMDAASGATERISAGSERAEAVGGSHLRADFLYATNLTFVGMEASEDQEIGAGAAAVALGGIEIELEDRKPGDLQQWLKTNDGRFTGAGHSSTVFAVKGTGIAYLGDGGSPEIEGYDTGGLAPGWYEIPEGADLRWKIDPDTDPATVATLRALDIQLIDANTRGAGEDATAVGSFREETEHSEEGRSQVTSSGRLPTSAWYAWVENPSMAIKQVLSGK